MVPDLISFQATTKYIIDLNKLKLAWRFGFRLEPIFANNTVGPKNATHFWREPKLIILLL